VITAHQDTGQVMLVVPGGQERPEVEFAAMLTRASFRLTRVVPTASAFNVMKRSWLRAGSFYTKALCGFV